MDRKCSSLPDELVGSVKEIPELSGQLEELSVDGKSWVSIFRCRVCGQYWKEYYVATGHGEVAHTKKIPPPDQAG